MREGSQWVGKGSKCTVQGSQIVGLQREIAHQTLLIVILRLQELHRLFFPVSK